MPTYSQTFPHHTADGTGWGPPSLKIAHDDGSLSILTPPTGDDLGPAAWQNAPEEIRSLDWSPRAQPAADVLRMHRDGALSRLNVWWVEQGAAGVDVGGHRIPSDTPAATSRAVQVGQLQPGQDLVTFDVTGLPVAVAAADVPAFAALYQAAFDQRAAEFAAARVAIEAATTVEQLTALPGLAVPTA
jgi:hypothetical protein